MYFTTRTLCGGKVPVKGGSIVIVRQQPLLNSALIVAELGTELNITLATLLTTARPQQPNVPCFPFAKDGQDGGTYEKIALDEDGIVTEPVLLKVRVTSPVICEIIPSCVNV